MFNKITKEKDQAGALKPSKENNLLHQDRRLQLFITILENVNQDGAFKTCFYDPEYQQTWRKMVKDLKYGKYRNLTETK